MPDIVNRSKRLLVFDGDDTLWDSQVLYTEAKGRLFRYLERFGCDTDTVTRYFEAEDLANVGTLGFTLHRFEHSIRNTIRAFCPSDSDNRESVERLIASIREAIENGNTPLVIGVERLLNELEPLYRIVLMTKGDPILQEHRISSSGLRRSFEHVYIVDEKTPALFKVILDEARVDAQEAWSIGNSLRSDIKPAVAVGMKGIWIEKATWAWEDISDHADQSIIKVKALEEIRPVLIPMRR